MIYALYIYPIYLYTYNKGKHILLTSKLLFNFSIIIFKFKFKLHIMLNNVVVLYYALNLK